MSFSVNRLLSRASTRRAFLIAVSAAVLTAVLVSVSGDGSRRTAVAVAVLGLLTLSTLKMVLEVASLGRGHEAATALLRQQLEKVSARVDATEKQIASLTTRIESTERRNDRKDVQTRELADRTKSLTGRTDRLDSRTKELADRTKSLSGRTDRLDVRTRDLADRTKELVAETNRAQARIDGVERGSDEAEQRHAATTLRLQRERRGRLSDFAARDSTGTWPSRLILQMTANRTGSTRMFDILRCHSDVYVEPLDFIWAALGLTGRRYPVGLSDLPGAATAIVAQPGLGVAIRSLSASFDGVPDRPTGLIAVEKAHPQFFGFDIRRFVDAMDTLESSYGVAIDIVYQVRSPLDVMWSMFEYKLRDPSWHGSLDVDGIPELVSREFEALARLSDVRPGLVLNFAELRADHPKMLAVAELIDPRSTLSDRRQWLERAFALTSQERLGATSFVGSHAERHHAGPDGAWTVHEEVIVNANTSYERLTSTAGGQAAPP